MSGLNGGKSEPLRLGILISGRGSNMQALIEASHTPDFKPALVISNRPEARGLALAQAHGIAVCIRDHKQYRSRKAFEAELDAVLKAHKIELIALAGFMRILQGDFVRRWSGRLLNIHPSLLPAYPGLNTHQRVLEDGGQWHGCSVHLVSEGVDEGPLLAQARLRVAQSDTPEALADRVLALEHGLYPACVAGMAWRLRHSRGAFESEV